MTHSAHIDRKLDRLLARLFVACLAILGIFAALSAYTCVRPAFTNVGDVHVNDPHAAVAAARLLIERQRRMPEKYREMISPQELPAPLRIANLRYANVHPDHVDLVLARNPDWRLGARIWAIRHQPHHDQATKFPEIFFYRYTNDAPVTIDNIP